MKKINLIITTIATLLLLNSCWKEEINVTKSFKTNTVGTWTIINDQNYVWYVKSENELNIWAKIWWKIIKLEKEIWDLVKSWELIAQLDAMEANSTLNSSNEIINSLQSLKNSTIESYDKQILSNQEKINQINKSLEIADLNIKNANSWVSDTNLITDAQIKTVENQILQAKNWLDMAKTNLENAQNTLKQKEIDIYTNSNSAINNSIILWNNLIDFFDNIYWASEKNKKNNDSFENYLSAKNKKYKDDWEKMLLEIIVDFENIKNYQKSDEKNYNLEYLNKSYNLFNNKITTFLNTSYKMMENTVDSVYFPTSQINEIKKQITEFQTKNQNLILSVNWNYIVWLKWSIDNINNFENEKKSHLDMLDKQVINANSQINILNETLNNYKAQTNSSKTQINSKYDEARKYKEILESQLNEAKIWIEALNKKKIATIDEINTQIAQVKSWKNTSWVMIENSKVYALFDWVITKKYAELWQVVWWWTPLYQISSFGDLKINILVWEEIEKKLKIWDEVNIEIDGLENIVKWKIKNIYPSKDLITKKTNLEISIEKNKDIKIWSYSKVSFKSGNDDIWIIIPNKSIIEKYLVPWVYVLENNKAVFKKIEILNQSNNFSLIKGLEIGNIIITEWKENIYDWEILK